jgi:hypothetical protein
MPTWHPSYNYPSSRCASQVSRHVRANPALFMGQLRSAYPHHTFVVAQCPGMVVCSRRAKEEAWVQRAWALGRHARPKRRRRWWRWQSPWCGQVCRRGYGHIEGRDLPLVIPRHCWPHILGRRCGNGGGVRGGHGRAPGEQEDGDNDNIKALFSDDNVDMPTLSDEQVALVASFETAHREEVTR